MNARERGKRNTAVVTGALIAAALGGTAAIVVAVQPASASTTSTTSSTSDTSSTTGGLSSDSGDSGSAHAQSGGS